MNKLRTRFAPSPTGALHIGGLRTALYAFALAKRSGGDFILRIEDTDKKREVKGSREKIEKLLKLFGLNWDEHYVQSERVEEGIYKKAGEKLEKEGHAYKEGGAVRLKIPKNEKVGFHDFVLDKDITWDTNTLEDLVLLKSDGFPTYHLAVVVDDNDMKISHVLRGHDWLPSTPIHLLVYKYLGFSVPEIGHLTDILDPEGGKLSKRKGSSSCEALLNLGYLPEAILNFVMLLGWAPKDNRELFSLREFVEVFDPSGFQKANPVFNREKLDWFNGHYIRNLPTDDLVTRVKKLSKHKLTTLQTEKILALIKDRMKTLGDFDKLSQFFFEAPKVSSGLWDNKNEAKDYLEEAGRVLEKLECSYETFNKGLEKLVKDKDWNTGKFFMALRIAICGSRVTPPITETMVTLGKEESLKRINKAVEILSKS